MNASPLRGALLVVSVEGLNGFYPDPNVLTQCAKFEHLWLLSLHSSISAQPHVLAPRPNWDVPMLVGPMVIHPGTQLHI